MGWIETEGNSGTVTLVNGTSGLIQAFVTSTACIQLTITSRSAGTDGPATRMDEGVTLTIQPFSGFVITSNVPGSTSTVAWAIQRIS